MSTGSSLEPTKFCSLADLDFSSLEYLTVIPKDLQNLIHNELLPEIILCRFASSISRSLANGRSLYLDNNKLASHVVRLVHEHFGNRFAVASNDATEIDMTERNPLDFRFVKILIKKYVRRKYTVEDFKNLFYPSNGITEFYQDKLLDFRDALSYIFLTDTYRNDNFDEFYDDYFKLITDFSTRFILEEVSLDPEMKFLKTME